MQSIPVTLIVASLFKALDSRRCVPCPSACPPAIDMLSAILLAYRLNVCMSVEEVSRRACGWGSEHEMGRCQRVRQQVVLNLADCFSLQGNS